jgi:hypothetical protein
LWLRFPLLFSDACTVGMQPCVFVLGKPLMTRTAAAAAAAVSVCYV